MSYFVIYSLWKNVEMQSKCSIKYFKEYLLNSKKCCLTNLSAKQNLAEILPETIHIT